MTSYQQMGHDSINLLNEPSLDNFRGAILSPVNYTKKEIGDQIARSPGDFDMVFDPQLYFPRTERKVLKSWKYFPSDVETADISSPGWWRGIVNDLITTCGDLGPDAICSPAIVPTVYNDEYYAQMAEVGSWLATDLNGSEIRPIQTGIVRLADLTTPGRPFEIASILSRYAIETIYLVFVSDLAPRREISDPEQLKGAMRLIHALASTQLRVIVGFTSTDLVLWKAAGAAVCASGKFFNLRRFTSSRFEEPSQGGGQLPYWFEESLLAFLRESDIVRLRQAGRLGPELYTNPFAQQILDQLQAEPGKAWVGLGWRQYLYAFADLEDRIAEGQTDVNDLLIQAERNWIALEDAKVLMEEPRNDGAWLRAWRRALVEFRA